ncbi:MAG: 2-oxo acid dehydrogenase subunit E2 [Moraxellaceae bacterium]|nr:2-oxo acid dehydrogenase subunit E2 [Moraxellaceae bacterium]
MKTFMLPDLGEGLHEATLVEWYAAPQSQLKQGEPLLAVETAKAIVEIPAPEDLTITTLLAEPNSVVKVGLPLLSYEAINQMTQATAPKSVSVVGELTEASTQASQHSFIIGQQRFNATELRQAHNNLQAKTQHSSTSLSTNEIALTGTRLAMMQQLSAAHQQVALVTLFDEVWVKWPTNTKPLPYLIAALCAACEAEPKLNAWFIKDKLIILHKEVNLGLAVNTPHGLFVPVIRQANLLTPSQLIQQIKTLKQAAQQHQLTPAQLQGATISLSNFGMMAGRFATPMIVPPQVAIIGIGKIEQRAVLSKKGKVKTKTVIPLSLSFDHRVLTGAEAAQFLAAFISHLKK